MGTDTDRAQAGPPADQIALRQALRQQAIDRRLALAAHEWERLSTTICAHIEQHWPQLAARRVAFCWPIRNEPDLRPLIAAWQVRGEPGFAALLPVVVGATAPLAFRRWTPDCAMTTDRYGIPTPSAGDFERPDALLIPVNAFDAAAYRIGYGGGFFDRTLAIMALEGTPPLAIGVGFESARTETTWPQVHDRRLDVIVTEAGVFEPGR